MKLSTTPKNAGSIDTAYTRITFIEKGVERLVYRDNTETLEVVSGNVHKITPRTFRTLLRTVVQSAKRHKLSKIALTLPYDNFKKLHTYDASWFWSTVSENILLADYEHTAYKSKPAKEVLSEILLTDILDAQTKTALKHGEIIGIHANKCRDIANTPGGDMTPQILAESARAALKGTKATVSILDEKAIAKLKMGGLLGVGKGAKDKPRFIVIEYWGLKKPTSSAGKVKSRTNKPEAPIVFVGKGITFDTGGLQIKPGMSMYEMHMDMSGGAAVIHALCAIAKLGMKKNVIGLIPAVENAVSGDAMRPGDVLTMMSGTTVEVLHTDAEGRLILADALHYARKYEPRLVIDVATLTGAALVAVGQHAHIIMTKDRSLEDTLRDLGEESGDYAFPLPLWDEYKQYIKGLHGDISNIPSNDSRYGGSINAGMFLAHFTKGLKWAHIDMAPRMTSVGSDKLAKGATGEPVRLLVKIAEKF